MPSKKSKALRRINKALPTKDCQSFEQSSGSTINDENNNKKANSSTNLKKDESTARGKKDEPNVNIEKIDAASKVEQNTNSKSKADNQKLEVFVKGNSKSDQNKSKSEFQSINQLFQDRVENYSDKHFICFPNRLGDEGKHEKLNFEIITYGRMGKMVNSISTKLNELFPLRKKGEKIRIIGLMCTSELNFLINQLALIKLGHSILIISPNNSISSTCHLMKSVNCSVLIYSPGQRTIVEEVVKLMEEKGIKVQSCPWITSKEAEEMDEKGMTNLNIKTELSYQEEKDEILLYLHSSGSTGHPKAIGRKHSDFVGNPYNNQTHGLILAPLLHTMCTGLVFSAMVSLGSVVLLPSSLSITSINLVDLAKESFQRGFQKLYSVPLLLKLIVDSQGGFEILKQFKSVEFGGATLPNALGDLLVESNVNLVSLYGSTETRLLLSSNRDFEKDKGWNVLRASKEFAPHMKLEEVWKEGEESIYELIVGPNYSKKAISNRPDRSFATSDLFKKSKEVENGYIYHSRLDDTIVHTSGLKTNPIPIEQEIRSSPFIREVIVFGQSRLQIGCLIIPYEDERATEEEELGKPTLIDQIWPTIESANRDSPSHSRIVRELVHILPATTRFPSADKGSVMRAKTLKSYEILIEEIYRTYEDGKRNNDQKSQKYSIDTLEKALKLVRRCVHTALKDQMGTEIVMPKDEKNLFDIGCDSLTVIRIGNMIRTQAGLPQDKSFKSYSPFDHPTIMELGQLLFNLSKGKVEEMKDDSKNELRFIKNMFEKLSNCIQERSEQRRSNLFSSLKGDCVVLTGATGALGAHILVQLCRLSSVEKVICLCRANNNDEADKRVEESLLKRKLISSNSTLCELENATRTKIICLVTDLNEQKIGLSNDHSSLEEILRDATHIIHNAWPVNFSMGISAFETALNGLVNMLNLCAHSHRKSVPTFTFCSSISAISNHEPDHLGRLLEVISDDPKDASQMGYGRGKWLAEMLCKKAVQQIGGLDCRIARIGQLSCDLQNGIWNEKEAWPALLKSGQILGVLPDLRGRPLKWLPIDLASNLIVAATLQTKTKISIIDNPIVMQMVNPNSTGWVNVIEAMKQSNIQFKIVSLQNWLETLANAKDQDPFTNPAIKLLSFYNSWIEEKRIEVEYDLTQLKLTLHDRTDLLDQIKPINTATLMKMIQAWKSNGFFK